MTVVQSRRARHPCHYLIDFTVVPLSAHVSPPAKRNAPSVELLTDNRREYRVGECVSGYSAIHLVAEKPEMLGIRPVLVGIDFRASIIIVGAQACVITLTANADVGTLGLFKRKTSVVAGVGSDERRVP